MTTLVLFVLQLLFLACALPLLAKSLQTSRSRRRRHAGYSAVASVLAIIVVILSLLIFGLSTDEAHLDVATTLAPSVVTLSMCGWVLWRALGPVGGAVVRPERRRARGLDA